MLRQPLLLASALALAGCGETAKQSVEAGMGASPQLLQPVKTLIPTINTAKAVGWPAGAAPTPAAGLQVGAFARGLEHPRWLYMLPNGDVLVAETNAPPKPDDGKGLRGFAQKLIMGSAGATVPSPNRISLLRDADRDGVAELKTTYLTGLNSPFGMALVGDQLFIANADALVRVAYQAGDVQGGKVEKVLDLPGGPRNHHWTKNVVASPDGAKLYVSVGSNSNVAENGMAAEAGRAAIWEVDIASGAHRVFATGLRNPVGMDFQPESGQLWTAVNERDEIGSDLVPDYMTSVRDGGFYGWPYSWYGQHVDVRVEPQRPDMVARAIVPDYALGPHTASLGLHFAAVPPVLVRNATPGVNANDAPGGLPTAWTGGAYVGQHGSWNRKPRSGYKVIFVPFSGGKPAGPPRDVLTGFLDAEGRAQGRPVGVIQDSRGALLVADDVGDVIWRVSGAAPVRTAAR